MPKPNLKNFRPPADRLSTERQPGDPSPSQIRARCREIQSGWTPRIWASRERDAGGQAMQSEVQIVDTRDMAAATRR
jgi:hypothetical protein